MVGEERTTGRVNRVGTEGTALKKKNELLAGPVGAAAVLRPKSRRRSLTVWASIVAFLFMVTIQPTASGLEFPRATHIVLPDSVDLAVKPTSMVALYTEFQTVSNISANVLALVSLASQQIELARSVTGAQSVARIIMKTQYHWSAAQFGCLKTLWNHESHWNYKAHNYSSGAHGIPQALPADKMNVIGTDWRTNPVTQIRWGLHYIDLRYSTPCKALATFNWKGSY